MNEIIKSDIDKQIGIVLKNFRVKNKLTQEQIAEKVGLSLKYISKIENGNGGIKTQTLINYMNILGITPNLLYETFITDESVLKDIKLSEKIGMLSDEKKSFLNSIIDLLENY